MAGSASANPALTLGYLTAGEMLLKEIVLEEAGLL
jgi:hypothetical protein